MATSTAAATDNKKYTYKFKSLVIDEGGSLCRNILLQKIQGRHRRLNEFLKENKHEILNYFNGLGGKPCVLRHDQYNTLFTHGNAATSYSKFDVTITMFLLRTFFYNRESDNHMWQKKLEDIYLENTSAIADLVRIREYRNKLSHIIDTRTWLTKTQFDEYWAGLSAVLLRLGPQFGVNNLQPKINELLNAPFDVEREHKLEGDIRNVDTKLVTIINHQVSKETAIDNLKERSKREIEDVLDEHTFVKTETFDRTEDILKNNGIVVLQGAQGEGKTTIAKKLLPQNKDKCFKLNTYADWRLVGCAENGVVYVLLDDMFGGGIFDETESRKWRKEINAIKAAVDNKTMYVIITSRTYILQEVCVFLFFETLINDKNTVTISSNDLTPREKRNMLANHLRLNERAEDKVVSDYISESGGSDAFTIGFPECVRLYAKHDALFKLKQKFFKSPMIHLKKCLVEMFEDEHSFLAFFVLWSQPTQTIVRREIELSLDDTSKSILNPIKKLQFNPDNCLRNVLPSLTKHAQKGGFIGYAVNTETFKFSHPVVSDAVGLVIAEKNTTAILEFCNTGFIDRYVCINTATTSAANDFMVHVIKSRYHQLCTRIGQLILNEHVNLHVADDTNPEKSVSLTEIAQELPEINHVHGEHKGNLCISTALLNHPVFQDKEFCDTFMNMKTDMLIKLLTTPIMTVGIHLQQLTCLDKRTLESEIHMSAYLVYTSNKKGMGYLAEKCFRLLQTLKINSDSVVETDLFMSMLMAAKRGDDDMIRSLHNLDARINSDIVFAAIEMGHSTTLSLLLEISGGNVNQYTKEDVSPLMFFVENNKEKAVSLLLKNSHTDCPSHPTNGNQTPLHKACELGWQPIVNLLIQNKAIGCEARDTNGMCPIHIAALKDRTEIVKMLLEHDRKQADYPVTLSNAVEKVLLFHIAVMQQNSEIVSFLEENDIPANCLDGKRQTPLLFAIKGSKYKILNQILAVSIKDKAYLLTDCEGNTPLHSIMMQLSNLTDTERKTVYKNVFIQLYQNDADISIKNNAGKTVEQIAKENDIYTLYTELIDSASYYVPLNEEISEARPKEDVSVPPSSNEKRKKKKKRKR